MAMEIAKFGVAIDPSGVISGTDQMRQALSKAQADMRAQAQKISEMRMDPNISTKTVEAARSKYALLTQAAKDYEKAIQARNVDMGKQQLPQAVHDVSTQPKGLTDYEASINRVKALLKNVQQEAVAFMQASPVGANPALEERLNQIKNLKKELGLLKDAYNAVKTPPPAPPAKPTTETKALLKELETIQNKIPAIRASLSRDKVGQILNPAAIAKDANSIKLLQDRIMGFEEKFLHLSMQKGAIDVTPILDSLKRVNEGISEVSKKARELQKPVATPDLTAIKQGSQGTPQNIKLLQTESEKANQKVKELTTSLAVLEAQGKKLSKAEAGEYARQLKEAEGAAKKLANGLEAVEGAQKKAKVTSMQLFGFFMGLQQVFGAPLAKAAGLSDKTQEVFDKMTMMGTAGFSAGQLISQAFGIGAAGALAVGGAVISVISQLNDLKAKVKDARFEFANMKKESRLTGDEFDFREGIGHLKELSKEMKDLGEKSWFRGTAGYLTQFSGNIEAANSLVQAHADIIKESLHEADRSTADFVTSLNTMIDKEKDSIRHFCKLISCKL